VIHPITIDQLLEPGMHLFAAAAEETGCRGPVNWDALRACESAGQLILLGVAENMLMVGYGCAVIAGEFWSADISCTTLSVFVTRPCSGRWAIPLLQAIALEGRARGATLFRVHAIPDTRFARMLRLRGLLRAAEVYESSIAGFLVGRCERR
jgi:hypothetical protein